MTAGATRIIIRAVKAPFRFILSSHRELTGSRRGLPGALILGAQKGGTTSLFYYLVRHPDVLPPFDKEIHYFDLQYERGERWYRSRFPYVSRLAQGKLTLDASPYYLAHPLAPERAARLLPRAKLIALLRNPVDRAFSHYQHEVRGGRESLSFAEAIEREAERTRGEEERMRSDPRYYSPSHHRHTYLRRGRYLEQLRRWAEYFPREQLLVLQSERLFRDPAGATAAAHEFLRLRPHRLARYKTFLPGKYDGEMPADLRARLAAYFEPYNRELYRWLGREFDWS